MSAGELSSRFWTKLRQYREDSTLNGLAERRLDLIPDARAPVLPHRDAFAERDREMLRGQAAEILRGCWVLFGKHRVQLESLPPRWQRDLLSGTEETVGGKARKLDHRNLRNGVDVRVLWELSRWIPLVRISQCAWIHRDRGQAVFVLAQLEDWQEKNPAGEGLNWTSPLEPGIRLVQFFWIDALLSSGFGSDGEIGEGLAAIRRALLPGHVWWVWNYKSFGTSANNHLIGELAGLILAVSRWRELEVLAAPINQLASLLEREVLAQFWEDGGNREQGLHYHLFAWELCWQAQRCLAAIGEGLTGEAMDRLGRAARFFLDVLGSTEEPWDYGDSDDAHVFPVYRREETALQDWSRWLAGENGFFQSWMGKPPALPVERAEEPVTSSGWKHYPQSGILVAEQDDWKIRFDASDLGLAPMAAHGHLDALHVSLWIGGKAFLIDPGTGGYFGSGAVRNHLTGWKAHNGPHFPKADFPRRYGPFLWGKPHARPEVTPEKDGYTVSLRLPAGTLKRSVRPLDNGQGWIIRDLAEPAGAGSWQVNWHLAPEWALKQVDERRFRCYREPHQLELELSASGAIVELMGKDDRELDPLLGICSPYYQRITRCHVIHVMLVESKASLETTVRIH